MHQTSEIARPRLRHVSTDDQTPLPQSEALQSAGCDEIFEEHGSGGNRTRPVLARVLERVQSGDTLVVVRVLEGPEESALGLQPFDHLQQVG